MGLQVIFVNPSLLKTLWKGKIVDTCMIFPVKKGVLSLINKAYEEKQLYQKIALYLKEYEEKCIKSNHSCIFTVAEVKNEIKALEENLRNYLKNKDKKNKSRILLNNIRGILEKLERKIQIIEAKKNEELEEKVHRYYYSLWEKKLERIIENYKEILNNNEVNPYFFLDKDELLEGARKWLCDVANGTPYKFPLRSKCFSYVLKSEELKHELYKKINITDVKLILASMEREIPLLTSDVSILNFQKEWNKNENKKIDVVFFDLKKQKIFFGEGKSYNVEKSIEIYSAW